MAAAGAETFGVGRGRSVGGCRLRWRPWGLLLGGGGGGGAPGGADRGGHLWCPLRRRRSVRAIGARPAGGGRPPRADEPYRQSDPLAVPPRPSRHGRRCTAVAFVAAAPSRWGQRDGPARRLAVAAPRASSARTRASASMPPHEGPRGPATAEVSVSAGPPISGNVQRAASVTVQARGRVTRAQLDPARSPADTRYAAGAPSRSQSSWPRCRDQHVRQRRQCLSTIAPLHAPARTSLQDLQLFPLPMIDH